MKEKLGLKDEEITIAFQELLQAVGYAVLQNTDSGNSLKVQILGVDNTNAVGWIQKRRGRPVAASIVLRFLARRLGSRLWTLHVGYIASELNDGADLLSRSVVDLPKGSEGFTDRSAEMLEVMMDSTE